MGVTGSVFGMTLELDDDAWYIVLAFFFLKIFFWYGMLGIPFYQI